MIYIFSQDVEYTTERVLDWIFCLGYSAKRINGSSIDKKGSVSIEIENNSNNIIEIDKQYIPQASIVGWYRRFGKPSLEKKILDSSIDSNFSNSILKSIKADRKVIKDFLISHANIDKWLTLPSLASMNKLKVLTLAKSQGFLIPPTLVCSSREALLSFFKKHNRVILKAISEAPLLSNFDEWHTYLTHEITEDFFDKVPTLFPPTCFQKMIEKIYEIRVFYLDEKCYSMAIFSQKDKTTSVDFRNYNVKKPNRNVPYKLPLEISNKIKNLMQVIGLNTGSIDLIKNKEGEYVFLEVNPVGQFGMVSRPCNYFLEKKVAEYLIKKENE